MAGPVLPIEPLTVDCREKDVSDLLSREWLVTNKLGSYASSSVAGANTRRYHGLLVAASLPPVGRQVVLSQLLEQVVIGEKTYPLSSFQFAGTISPNGHEHLVRFETEPTPTWTFQLDQYTVTRQLTLAEHSNTLAVRYKVEGPGAVELRAWPFVALRDFHGLRRVHDRHQILFSSEDGGIRIEDRQWQAQSAWLACQDAQFVERAQWWYRFQYSIDIGRGQEGFEDLYTPGYFQTNCPTGQWIQLTAATERSQPLDFEGVLRSRNGRRAQMAAALGSDADQTARRLAAAADDFLVTRNAPSGRSTTIVAGYHWFGDWGRDSFIALPGLTLLTGQYDQARQVLDTFAHAVRDGMVPNRFDDYGGAPHYNSIDASLWFILALDKYLCATGDEESWSNGFIGVVRSILQSYHDGTQFDIHADADGLITGGNEATQLTWMDVKFDQESITPRQGKAVEINAMWLEALHIMAGRCRGVDEELADHYAGEAQRVGASFVRAFWHEQGGYLYDCISPTGSDASFRPNQIIAVAMPHCPLKDWQQQSVVRLVQENLLTARGLRTLSPSDPRYRGQYGGSWESRDRAYHQGTVWPWLIGYFVQAYLKVNGFSTASRRQAAEWLAPFDEHLREAGLGTISEIADGSEPHISRGCIAQAWSVAEVLRAKRMVQKGCML